MNIEQRRADSKPRVGDQITYRGVVVGRVTRVEGNLCWRTYPDGESLPFIWRFKDGLNNLHSWPGKDETLNTVLPGTPPFTQIFF